MATVYERIAWSDQFNAPTVDQLRKALNPDDAKLFDTARKQLGALDDLEESFSWFGHGWQWAVEYRRAGEDAPIAIIIPNPEDLQLAIPLPRKFVETLSTRDMKRTIRDGLELAQAPFDTEWGVWTIMTPGIMGDLKRLIERKLVYLG